MRETPYRRTLMKVARVPRSRTPPPMHMSDRDGGAGGQDVTRVLGNLTHILAPTSFVVAIMMYFGAVRTNTMYGRLGIDQSMLGLSYQDYVLRSAAPIIESLVLVLVAALVMALIAPPVHMRLIQSVAGHRTAAIRTLAVVSVFGVAGAAVGVLGMASWVNLPRFVMQVCLGLGALVLVYSASLYRRVDPRRTASATDQTIRRGVCMALLLILLLWSVAAFAQQQGQELANQYRANPRTLPSTVVYAARRLFLEGPGITETTLPDPKAMFRYRYTGLRLLIHSNRRYFLLPDCWATSLSTRVIALPATDLLRLEFLVLQVPPACPPVQ
jgi:hypothetical protein